MARGDEVSVLVTGAPCLEERGFVFGESRAVIMFHGPVTVKHPFL